MELKTLVWIRTTFEGFHRWKDAPEDVKFLRDFHRHIFEVELGVAVNNDDREIEFFQFKRKVDMYINTHYKNEYFDLSCEMVARKLLNFFHADFVKVSEDGENGATVIVQD